PRLRDALVHPWPNEMRARMLAVSQGEAAIDLDAFGHLDTAVGACFADAVQALLRQSDIAAHAVRAIGSHGQTLRHRSGGDHPCTLQLGNPWLIAERCGIDTVADFRRADMAAAGQGARSEEHTSELQSRFDLVCRLLLEKKKTAADSRTCR